jgi:Ca2+-binding EF-hand superfamily protein
MFETAPNPSYMQDIETLQKFNVFEVLNDIANFVKEKSSIEALKKVFTTIDEKGEKHVDAEDFRWGMIDLGYNLSKREADEIILHYDNTGMNVLFYETFIESLQ